MPSVTLKALGVYAFVGLTLLAGLGSLLVFGRFLGPMRLGPPFGLPPLAAAAANTLLCLLFFLQHSGMVRRAFRRWSERWVPASLSRALYTWTSALALILLCLLWQPIDPAPRLLPAPLPLLFRAVPPLALLGFLWAFFSIEDFDLFGTRALLRRPQSSTPLAIRGPFRWVRHPFYFLVLVLLWITPSISADRLLLNALFTLWIYLGTRWEERDLLAEFGPAYRQYQAQVPMLLPRPPRNPR